MDIGLALPPPVFLDNVANFSIEIAEDKYVYVEDFYDIDGPNTVESYDTWKFNATTAHLDFAAKEHQDSLFISFSSAEVDSVEVWPKVSSRGYACGC